MLFGFPAGRSVCPARRQALHRKMNQPVGRNFAVIERVDRDPAAHRVAVVAVRIGQRGHARIQVASVAAESEAGIEGLLGAQRRARVRKIAQRIFLRVENRKRLLVLRLEGAKARVHRHHVTAVGRDGHGEGQAVDAPRIAGNLANKLLAGGQIDHLRARSRGHGKEGRRKDCQKLCLHAKPQGKECA
jgi:hypothetical protein